MNKHRDWLNKPLPQQRTVRQALVLLIVCSSTLPVTAKWYEATMSSHMLLQLPLLGLCGWLLPSLFPGIIRPLYRFDPYGAIAVVVFTGCSLFWMLPVNLDLTVSDSLYRAVKVITVPVGIGLALRWIWLRSHAVLKIVVLFELWASVTRLGWLYLESPIQLCSNYLISEQQFVGNTLLLVSMVAGFTGLTVGFFGRYSVSVEQHMTNTGDSR